MMHAINSQARWRSVVLFIIVLNTVPELVLQSADRGLVGSTWWRLTAYSYGALWPGLLIDWRANFVIQPVSMFFTYGFLHSNLVHLIGNMAVLFYLASMTRHDLRQSEFIQVYLAALVGGAVAYALFAGSLRPMVGASGAVYGLAAAWIYCDMRTRRAEGKSMRRTWINLSLLLACNLVNWWLVSGELAWQTHLGGAVSGWACAWWLARRRKHRTEPSTS